MAVPPPIADPDKTALRRALRARRRDHAGDAGAIVGRLAPLLTRAGPIAAYVAHGGEPDILPFLRAAFDQGHDVALPRVAWTRMRFLRWRPDAPLEPGFAGILQPPADGAPVTPAIVLTPLVGFDRAGRRLGQGGGFYDRWFAEHPGAMRIGIAWSVQEVPALAAEPWDVPLHAIVTEKEWIAP